MKVRIAAKASSTCASECGLPGTRHASGTTPGNHGPSPCHRACQCPTPRSDTCNQGNLGVRSAKSRLGPERVLVSGALYDQARRIWNGAVDHEPALIVRAETAAEVRAAVMAGRCHHLPGSVRGGGHDWAGRALRPGGLVIDLTGMRQVAVDTETRTATVGGGATAREVIAAAAPHGLVAATGTCGSVGMTGLTLVGGYGPLNGRFGLALDNLLAAEVVLADGRLVTVDAAHEPE